MTLVPVYSRLKQDYTNFFLQATFGLLLKLASKFGAILSQTYKDMTLYPHMYQNVHCNKFQKNFSIQEWPLYSQISVIRTPIIRNYWVIRRRWTVPTFFSIIYCNKTTNYSNFDYPKKSIFRSDSSVPIEEVAIKLPFKIRSPKVTHDDHDFFVWSSSIYTPE